MSTSTSCAAHLDSETTEFLRTFAETFAAIAHLSIPEQRLTIKRMFSVPEEMLEPIGMKEDKVVIGRNGPINIRLFTPKTPH